MLKNDNLLTITSAAKLLGVNPATLRKWDNEGKIKAIRLGTRGDRRYRREDLQQFIQQNDNEWKPIDENKFQQWLAHGNFWMEEASFLFLIGDVPGKQMAQLGGWLKPAFTNCLFTFENGYMHQILSVDESIAMSKAYVHAWKENPAKLQTIFDEWAVHEKKLEQVMDRLEFVDLRHLSNEKLIEEFNVFVSATEPYWKCSLTLEPYQPYIDSVLLPRFISTVKNHKDAKEAFAVLASPPESSFIAEERKDLLRMAVKYLHNPEYRKQFLQLPVEEVLAHIKREKPDFFSELQAHQQQYYWMQNSYSEWAVLTLNHFVQFLQDTIKDYTTIEMKAELARMENKHQIEVQQRNYIESLRVPAELVHELKFIQRITWLKDDRKRIILITNHHFFRFIHEIARRSGYDYRAVGFAQVNEIPQILNQSFSLEKLEQRRNSSAFISQEGKRYAWKAGNQSLPIFEKIFSKKDSHQNMQEIHGIVASRGSNPLLRGKVKIVLDPKNQTIGEDEILVASMTRPEFLPLMKKAKAFITNEGGITCHAAIVSREMNKACIIGTLHATKALKDGDEVEMLMNHGVVRILQKATD